MNDIWVCDSCKSINRRRDDKCYHCRAARSGAMETPGLDVRADNAAAERTRSSYVISWPLALITAALLVAVAILGIVILKLTADNFPALKQALLDSATSGGVTVNSGLVMQSVQISLLSLVRTGLTLLALLCFAGWLALVTRNVPLLGGGAPSRGPVRVFIYALIPIWNLIKVPGMVQDLLYRVDPEGGGAFMVLAAWVGLVGSYLVSLFGSWAITAAGVRAMIPKILAGDVDGLAKVIGSLLDQSFWLGIIVELMVAAGTVLLALIMLRIESRCAARDREIRAQMAASGAPTLPTGPNWPTGQPVTGQPTPEPATPNAGPSAPGPSGYGVPASPTSPYGPSSTTSSSPYGQPPGPPPPPPGTTPLG